MAAFPSRRRFLDTKSETSSTWDVMKEENIEIAPRVSTMKLLIAEHKEPVDGLTYCKVRTSSVYFTSTIWVGQIIIIIPLP